MIATRSPASTPAAMNPLASARTSALNCAAVTSDQVPSAVLRRSMTADGCSAARRGTTSAAFADAGISARAGMLYSRKRLSVLRPPPSMFYLMRVHVVSDVHGMADALKKAGDGADMLICLGDMFLFLDYADHTQGIFAELYGAEHAREYIDLRTARRFDEARQLTAGIAARLTADRGAELRQRGVCPRLGGGGAGPRLPPVRQCRRAPDVERVPEARPPRRGRRPGG